MKRGSETRSLETEDQLFTVTIEEALSVVLRHPNSVATALPQLLSASSVPIPESGAAIVLRSGFRAVCVRWDDECVAAPG